MHTLITKCLVLCAILVFPAQSFPESINGALSPAAAILPVESQIQPALKVDGKYQNWAVAADKGTFWVRLKFLARRLANSLTGISGFTPAVYASDSLGFDSTPNSITWIGHATFLIQMEGVTILTDPIWSSHTGPLSFTGPPRLVEPGVALADLPQIDAVVISHNHYDHLDTPTLRKLFELNPDTRFLVPMDNGNILRSAGINNITELNWGDDWQIGDLTITCLPAQHWSRRSAFDGNRSLWASWAVRSPDHTLYFAGDTAYQSHFQTIKATLGPVDIALLPIGAYEPEAMMKPSHLDPEEAVQAGLDLGARTIVSMHYGTYDLSDEPIDEPPIRFSQAAEAAGFLPANTWNLRMGETRSFYPRVELSRAP